MLLILFISKTSSILTSLLVAFVQRAWLLKLLAIELHAGDMSSSNHREACHNILAHLFGGEIVDIGDVGMIPHSFLQNGAEYSGTRTISKSKVLFVT